MTVSPGRPPAATCVCTRGWQHCHATLVVHRDGVTECTLGPDCTVPSEAHDLVVDCVEVGTCLCARS